MNKSKLRRIRCFVISVMKCWFRLRIIELILNETQCLIVGCRSFSTNKEKKSLRKERRFFTDFLLRCSTDDRSNLIHKQIAFYSIKSPTLMIIVVVLSSTNKFRLFVSKTKHRRLSHWRFQSFDKKRSSSWALRCFKLKNDERYSVGLRSFVRHRFQRSNLNFIRQRWRYSQIIAQSRFSRLK